MKVFKLIIILLLVANLSQAQSAFKRMPKPAMKYSVGINGVTSLNPIITAWRFTPAAGYNVSTKQLMAGIGYGIQWMRFIDSTQKYYTKFSLQAIGWVNGNTAPTLNPPNFASFGVSAGFFNQLIMIGGAYSPATPATKGSVGFVVNLAIPLNN